MGLNRTYTHFTTHSSENPFILRYYDSFELDISILEKKSK